MSNESRRLAKARRADKRLQAVVTNPVIDEDDPSAILDVWFAETARVHEALQPKKSGRKIKRARSIRLPPRNRAEGTTWIKRQLIRRAHAAGYTRLPRGRYEKLLLLAPIVDEANRILSETGELFRRFTTDEFLRPQHSV
jgi:hypothetical protein